MRMFICGHLRGKNFHESLTTSDSRARTVQTIYSSEHFYEGVTIANSSLRSVAKRTVQFSFIDLKLKLLVLCFTGAVLPIIRVLSITYSVVVNLIARAVETISIIKILELRIIFSVFNVHELHHARAPI